MEYIYIAILYIYIIWFYFTIAIPMFFFHCYHHAPGRWWILTRPSVAWRRSRCHWQRRSNVRDPGDPNEGWQLKPKMIRLGLPSGKLTKNYWKSPFLMGQSTISMAIFNSYVSLPEGISWGFSCWFLMNVGKKKPKLATFFSIQHYQHHGPINWVDKLW